MSILFTDYNQVIDFFNERASVGIKPGLDRVLYLLNQLNHPHQKIKAVHIAGTNGKGSTLSYLRNALAENGYKVGVFSSPSYEGLQGHIYAGTQKIPKESFLKLMNEILPFIAELDEIGNHPTDFEIITVLSFLYFNQNVDIALIETGMGGREDTTNCIKPMLSIITNVDYDHTAFLGNSLSDIASHKAGIIKEKVPVVIGEEKEVALEQIKKEATLKNARIYQMEKDFSITNIKQSAHMQQFSWQFQSHKMDVTIQMIGSHQLRNASLAMMALNIISESGLTVQWDKALEGMLHTTVPGRFEKINERPIIFIDGAHNIASVDSFIKTVLANYKETERHLVFAAFKDKDIKPMIENLLPHFKTMTLTTFDSNRAARAEDLAELVNSDKIIVQENWQDLVTELRNKTNENTHYFITGSLHFITLVRNYVIR